MNVLFGKADEVRTLEKGRMTRILLVGALVIAAIVWMPLSGSADEVKPEIAQALQSGDTAKAIDLLNHEIELDKSYYLNYYMLGLIYFNQGKCEQAKKEFLTALDKKKKHYESLYQLGLCYLRLNQLDSAQAVMEKGRKKAKKGMRHIFENGYGLVMLKKGECQEADKAFRQALVDEPDNPEYLINLGDANFCQGVPSLAATYYAKALEIDTGSTEVYYHWAEACLEMRDYNCAIEKLRIVLSRDSTYANAWMRAGGIYFKAALSTTSRQERKARFKDAIGSYLRYLELSHAKPDSSNVRVFFELAMSYVNLYGFEEAVKYFEDVLSIPYEPRDIYFYYGKALWGSKKYVKAADMLLKHIEWVKQQGEDYRSKIKDAELYQLLGDCYFYRKPKDYTTAVKYYVKSLEANPNQKRILKNTAIAYHTMKSHQQALEYYDKRIAMGIDTNNAPIYKNAGYCALNLANSGAGGDELEEDIDETGGDEVTAENPVNYYELAADYLVRYLEFHPDDTNVLSMVANTYLYQLADCENGVTYYKKVLELQPNNCDAKKALGFAYFGGVCTKNYTKAVKYLKEAYSCVVSNKSACEDVNLLLWIAQCYHLRAAQKVEAKEDGSKDFKSAYEWYEKCLKCDSTNPDCKKGRDEVFLEFGD